MVLASVAKQSSYTSSKILSKITPYHTKIMIKSLIAGVQNIQIQVRHNCMKFLINLISNCADLVGVTFKSNKDLFKSFFQYIHKDPSTFTFSILQTIYHKVIMNHSLSNKIKALITNIQNIEILLVLYNSSYNKLRKFVHKYLLSLLCNNESKIFTVSYDNHNLALININDPIMKLLKNSQPISDPLQKSFVLLLLKTFPDYIIPYNMQLLSINMNGRLSLKWVSSCDYIMELINIKVTLSKYFYQNFVIENVKNDFDYCNYIIQLFPICINKSIISVCISSKVSLIAYNILELLKCIMNKIENILNQLKNIIINSVSYASPFTPANENILYSKYSEIIDTLIQYLPDSQMILSIRNIFPLNLLDKKTILLHSCVYDIIYKYITILPPLLLKTNLQLNKLINSEFENYPSLLQYSILNLIINTVNPLPQYWFNETKLSSESIRSLLFTYVNENSDIKIKKMINKFLYNLCMNSEILFNEGGECYFGIWLNSLNVKNINYFVEILQSCIVHGEYINYIYEYIKSVNEINENYFLFYSGIYLLITKYSIEFEEYICYMINNISMIYNNKDELKLIINLLNNNEILKVIYKEKYNEETMKLPSDFSLLKFEFNNEVEFKNSMEEESNNMLIDYKIKNKSSIFSDENIIKCLGSSESELCKKLNSIPLFILLSDSFMINNKSGDYYMNNIIIFGYLYKRLLSDNVIESEYPILIPLIVNKISEISNQNLNNQTISNMFELLYAICFKCKESVNYIINFINKLFSNNNNISIIHSYCIILIYYIYEKNKNENEESTEWFNEIINSFKLMNENSLSILLYYFPITILSNRISNTIMSIIKEKKILSEMDLYLLLCCNNNNIKLSESFSILKLISNQEIDEKYYIKIIPKIFIEEINQIKSNDFIEFFHYFNENHLNKLLLLLNEENCSEILGFLKIYIDYNYCKSYLINYLINELINQSNEELEYKISYLWSIFPQLCCNQIINLFHTIIIKYLYSFKIVIKEEEYADLIITLKYVTKYEEITSNNESKKWLKREVNYNSEMKFDKLILSVFLINDEKMCEEIIKEIIKRIINIEESDIKLKYKLLEIIENNIGNIKYKEILLNDNELLLKYKEFISKSIIENNVKEEIYNIIYNHLKIIENEIIDYESIGFDILKSEKSKLLLSNENNTEENDKIQSIYLKLILYLIKHCSIKATEDDLIEILKYYNLSITEKDLMIYQFIEYFCNNNNNKINIQNVEYRYGKYIDLLYNKESLDVNMSWIYNINDIIRIRQSVEYINLIKMNENNEIEYVENNNCSSSIICNNNYEIRKSIFNSKYLLELLIYSLSSVSQVNCLNYVSSNYIGYVICNMSSNELSIRKLSYRFLSLYYNIINSKSSKFNEKLEILLLLKSLKNSINESCEYIPSTITIFLFESLNILLKPNHNLYKPINKFLISRSNIDLKDVPMFYSLFNSGNETYKSDRSWIMRNILKSMSSEKDYDICLRRHIFNVMFSYFDSILGDNYTRLLILRILKRCINNNENNIINLYNSGLLLSWISNILMYNSRSILFLNGIIYIINNIFEKLESVNVLLLPLCIDYINICEIFVKKLSMNIICNNNNNIELNKILKLFINTLYIVSQTFSMKLLNFKESLWFTMSLIICDLISLINNNYCLIFTNRKEEKEKENIENVNENENIYSDVAIDFPLIDKMKSDNNNSIIIQLIKTICYIRPKAISYEIYEIFMNFILNHFVIDNSDEILNSICMFVMYSFQNYELLNELKKDKYLCKNILNFLTFLPLNELEKHCEEIKLLYQNEIIQKQSEYDDFFNIFIHSK